ncbi:hypothetical protein BSY17_4132 (plasmid) [Sphingobium sp. RAC03]|nr:hypothetical protein BSY17_4132 [Sphingobium sp. RAC03]
MAQDMRLSPVITDAGAHDAPYLYAFRWRRLIALQAVARFKKHGSASLDELATDKAAIDDRDHDMPLDGAGIAIDHHDIIVVNAGINHAAAADAEYETCCPIEP